MLFRSTPLRGELNGNDLVKVGLRGPEIGEVLQGIRLARMDGAIVTLADEENYVRSHLERRE